MAIGPAVKIVSSQEDFNIAIKELKLNARTKIILTLIIMLLSLIIINNIFDERLLRANIHTIVLSVVSIILSLNNIKNIAESYTGMVDMVKVRANIFNSLLQRNLYCFVAVEKENGTTLILRDRNDGGFFLRYYVEYKLPRLGKNAIIFLKMTSVAIYPDGV